MYAHLDTTDLNDPEVIIKIDISNAFNILCRALTLDVINGKDTREQVHTVKSKTGGQQGDCQATPLQFLNIHILLVNRCSLQQQQ